MSAPALPPERLTELTEALRGAYMGPPRPDAHERAADVLAPLVAHWLAEDARAVERVWAVVDEGEARAAEIVGPRMAVGNAKVGTRDLRAALVPGHEGGK